jgi:hypothetical protein
VNATGTIDSAYKVGVLFNSSYTSVTQNHTNNATVKISGGNLEVNLTYPPIPTINVDQNTTFNVNATVTCRNADCGNVYGTVRYNASSANPDTAINTTLEATPFYITSLNATPVSACKPLANQSEPRVGFCQIPTWSYTPHKLCMDFINTNPGLDGDCTGRSGMSYPEYPDGIADASDIYGINLRVGAKCGDSNYEQMADVDNNCTINTADSAIASRGGSGSYVYNLTGVYVAFNTGDNKTLDSNNCTWIPTNAKNFTVYNSTNNTVGAMVLFYAPLSRLSCGTLNKDQTCQLNWTLNATGTPISGYKIGVLFNSSYSSVTQNHTNNATITIIECTESMSIGWSSIYFGYVGPNTVGTEAPGNDNKLYNITNTGTCTLKTWIKGTDLENTTLPYPNMIGTGNLTWSNTTNSSTSSYAMTTSYTLLNSSLTPTIKNITTYYWLSVPPVYAGQYNGTIYICENTTQQSGASNTCT